jgi:hypothetical protein
MAALVERGTLHPPCASSFPSLTPVCLSAIATGRHPDGSFIPGLTWYRRGEGRFVEYGSSFSATLVEGSHVAVNDSVMNLNHLHLSHAETTLFEMVEDAGLVAASINFPVFRGRVRHPLKWRPAAAIARRIGVFDAAYGPSRFFFGELFASDRTGAPANLGVNTSHDRHAAAIGRWLVTRDGFDFLLYYLPDVDQAQHRSGPEGVLDDVAQADGNLARLADAAGGLDAFLERYAVILLADHGQTSVVRAADLRPAFDGLRLFAGSPRSKPEDCQVALAASNRVAMLYRLTDAPAPRALAARVEPVDGVDLVAFGEGDDIVVRRAGGELRFRRGGPVADRRGNTYTIDGDAGVLVLERDGDVVTSSAYPNALERIAGLLGSVNAGEVVVSAGPGVEFLDGGGSSHVPGGSHGSLSADDSVVPLVTFGVDASSLPAEPSITDVHGLVRRHFGL